VVARVLVLWEHLHLRGLTTMIVNRRWNLLGYNPLRREGTIGTVYHWVDKDWKQTACGIKLPESCGLFWDRKTPAERKKARCPECVRVRGAKT
jgi:hypothetical protein